MSMTATSPPSRRTACAISTPTGPPPRMSSRRGIAFIERRLAAGPDALELAQTRNRRDDRIGAVREDHVVGGVAHAVDLDDARAGEPAAAAQQIDAVDPPASAPVRHRSSPRP